MLAVETKTLSSPIYVIWLYDNQYVLKKRIGIISSVFSMIYFLESWCIFTTTLLRNLENTTNRVTRSTGLRKGHTLHLPKESDKKTNNGAQNTTQFIYA